MHLKVKIIDSFTLHKRGIVLCTNLDYDKEHHRFNKGDTLSFNKKTYEILSIQAILKGGRGNVKKDYVAFLVK